MAQKVDLTLEMTMVYLTEVLRERDFVDRLDHIVLCETWVSWAVHAADAAAVVVEVSQVTQIVMLHTVGEHRHMEEHQDAGMLALEAVHAIG